ncbi:PD-(D/E)XK nuclease family protein [Oceanospirillum sanctuarii]|uniref:PDDEXK-like family protein n=1 Tax=Oceanospirillum sanctuarii TaxID=1434821 RepID=UPI000A3CD7F2|nr:PD-(D/E)XK nuclease family protein [Oceanospirillum sanctuarii]
MFSNELFNTFRLLREKYENKPEYNLFKVLRSESDEVRLHSRFLCHLLDPNQNHGLGTKTLYLFLKTLNIDLQESELTGAEVYPEYQNIDILIKTQTGKAIIIENKIYALDQPKQLSRYYQIMEHEGFTDENMTILYLSLDGHEPSEDSTSEIPKDFLESDNYSCISYSVEIRCWIQSCIEKSATKPALRESLIQYLNLIEELTGMTESQQHIDELKSLLNQDNNIAEFQALQHAYTECLVDYQLDIWKKILERIQSSHPDMSEKINYDGDFLRFDDATKKIIQKFHYSSRSNKWYGVSFTLPKSSAQARVEIEEHLYLGIACSQSEYPEDYAKIISIRNSKSIPSETEAEWWPMYKYTSNDINFAAPSIDDLTKLSDETEREKLAFSIADKLYEIWLAFSEELKKS